MEERSGRADAQTDSGPPAAQKKFQVRLTPAGLPRVTFTVRLTRTERQGPGLQLKGFSEVTINSLGVLTGAQLFSLNKDELKTVCPDDGARVYSQITVQKAALERSSGSELQEIMRSGRRTGGGRRAIPAWSPSTRGAATDPSLTSVTSDLLQDAVERAQFAAIMRRRQELLDPSDNGTGSDADERA
ncbi:hypothetical protein cypCar_00041679 [Cyprinus carpio]|nr:hypothetical protein cypCar_00041679 [Cyprinus carpio]